MMRVSGAVLGAAEKVCSEQRIKLERKQVSLNESLALLQSLRTDMESDAKWQKFGEVGGVVAGAVSLVTDVIMDSVEVVSTGQPAAKAVFKYALNPLYQAAADQKWDGNKRQEAIDDIESAMDAVKIFLPDEGGTAILRKTVDVFGNMARNTVGIIGFAEDAADSRKSIQKSLAGLEQQIVTIERQLKELQAELEKTGGCIVPPAGDISQPPVVNFGPA